MAATKRVSGLRRALEKAERELEEHAERERQRAAREEALLSRLCLLETAYKELQKEHLRAQAKGATRSGGLHARFGRTPTRFLRPVGDDQPGDSRAVVTVATRLAREGHSRDEVKSFLKENFEHIDVASTVETAFGEEAAPEAAQA